MKTMIQKSLRFFILAACIAGPMTVQAANEYTNATDLMKDFLNLTVKKDAPMQYWVSQFVSIIKMKDKATQRGLRPFLKAFHKALTTRSALSIGMVFKLHKNCFGEPGLTTDIERRLSQPNGLNMLSKILKARLSKQ